MLVPMQPPPTTTASARRGTRDVGIGSGILCLLIALSLVDFYPESRIDIVKR
jgi:hypothetical protein